MANQQQNNDETMKRRNDDETTAKRRQNNAKTMPKQCQKRWQILGEKDGDMTADTSLMACFAICTMTVCEWFASA